MIAIDPVARGRTDRVRPVRARQWVTCSKRLAQCGKQYFEEGKQYGLDEEIDGVFFMLSDCGLFGISEAMFTDHFGPVAPAESVPVRQGAIA